MEQLVVDVDDALRGQCHCWVLVVSCAPGSLLGGQLRLLWDLNMRVSAVSNVEQAAETDLF